MGSLYCSSPEQTKQARADVNSFGHSTDAESDAPAQWIMELTHCHVSAKAERTARPNIYSVTMQKGY